MDAVRTVAPVGYPVTLQEAKDHCRVDHADDDALISGLIAAATDYLEGPDGILGRAILPQTWREERGGFSDVIPLRMGPVSGVVSVAYTDDAGSPQTVTGSRVLTNSGASCVVPALGSSWPSGSAVVVEYTAGSVEVPAPLKVAILLHVGSLYENRESISDKPMSIVPLAYHMLIAPYRRFLV